MAGLNIDTLSVSYGPDAVLRNVSLSLTEGEIGVLLGPSGSGKSTLLRAIAGFAPLQTGEIRVGDSPVESRDQHVPPHRRGIGMVFQDHALFPHLDVAANVAFGLRGLPREERDSRVTEMLQRIGLSDRRGAMPHELSGGQQQRVALARALAPRPALLLLDEPFANLDRTLRASLSLQVRDWLHELGTTALMVTHDPDEALRMADRLGVIVAGRLVQWSAPEQAWREPATRSVAELLGNIQFVTGYRDQDGRVSCPLGSFPAPDLQTVGPVDVAVRPSDLVVHTEDGIAAHVLNRRFAGDHWTLTVSVEGQRLKLKLYAERTPEPGETLRLRWVADRPVCFGRAEEIERDISVDM